MAIKEVLRHINIAGRCRKELESLQSLLISLQDINSDMQMYRVASNSGQLKFSENLRPAFVDKWLRKQNMLLQEAPEMAQECTIPRYNKISRYRTSKNIASMIKSMRKHLDKAAVNSITTQLAQSLCLVRLSNREMTASSSFSSTLLLAERIIYVGEPLVLGQGMAFARLQELVPNASRIGVVGMGGSGKTLLNNHGTLPPNISEEIARGVCNE